MGAYTKDFSNFPMKVIADLGMMYPTKTSTIKSHYVLVECPFCKKHFKAQTYHVISKNTNSCGCVGDKKNKERLTIHGLKKSRIYKQWQGIKGRCYNKKNKVYKNYGGRGITVCDEWKNDFKAFYDWAMANGYKEGLQIDRRDNDGNYCPENCRFVTRMVNTQNTRLLMSTNTSGYRGVHFDKKTKKWRAVIRFNNIIYSLGYFYIKEDAAKSFNNFVIKNQTSHPLNIILI